jgi:hypothetical protein
MGEQKKLKYPKDKNHKERVETGRNKRNDAWWKALVLREKGKSKGE